MANPKEKTPMCLLNELARYNKLVPLYELMDETGPAHEKTFVVCLTLGQQKYDAKGSSIKKAQHQVRMEWSDDYLSMRINYESIYWTILGSEQYFD